MVRSEMLFLGSQGCDELGPNKEEFLAKLHQLPSWNRTIAWGHSQVLRPCGKERQKEKPYAAPRPRYTLSNRSYDDRPVVTGKTQKKENFSKLLLSGAGWLKKLWQRMPERKVRLKYLILLVAAGMLFGLVMTLHSVKKKFHWSHWSKEHHHKHNDH